MGGGCKRCDIASQPEPSRKKGKGSNSSFLANAQVILPKYDSKVRSEGGGWWSNWLYCYRCLPLAEVEQRYDGFGCKRWEDQPYFCQNVLVFVPLEQNNVSLNQNDTFEKLHNHCKNVPLVDKADWMFNKEPSQHIELEKYPMFLLENPNKKTWKRQ